MKKPTKTNDKSKIFVTEDGYKLHRVGEFLWSDGDLTFVASKDGWPIDRFGKRLSGFYRRKTK